MVRYGWGNAPKMTRTSDLRLKGRRTTHGYVIAGLFTVLHTVFVPSQDISERSELFISLHSVLVVHREELDDYDNQCVRPLD